MIRRVHDTPKARIFREFYLLQDYFTGWMEVRGSQKQSTTTFSHTHDNEADTEFRNTMDV